MAVILLLKINNIGAEHFGCRKIALTIRKQMSEKYSLQIINSTDNKRYKQFSINNEKVIGAFENEPFMIEFTNNSWSRIQLRCSIDGTDILTGDLASTDPSGKVWVVEPYSKLELKAWPTSDTHGAEFIFGKEKNSVAANTHGFLGAKGLIGISVFEEGYIPPQTTTVWTNTGWSNSNGTFGGTFIGGNDAVYGTRLDTKSTQSDVRPKSVLRGISETSQLNYLCLDNDLAVGAGEEIKQIIIKTVGLKQPKLAEVIQIKYEWWDSLRSKLRGLEIKEAPYKAFPADSKFVGIDLKATPRVMKKKRFVEYSRFEDK